MNAAISGTNTIGGSTPSGNLTYSSAYPIVATFFDPGNPSTSATTDFVSLRCDAVGSDLNVTLNAYGINGNLLTSYTTLDVGGETLQVSASGIHSVQFIGTDHRHGATVDNFSFDTVVPVPEPSTGALLLVAGAFFYGIWRKGGHTLDWKTGEPNNAGGIEYYATISSPLDYQQPAWNDLSNTGGGDAGGVFGVVEVVPEPQTYACMLVCVGALFISRRKPLVTK